MSSNISLIKLFEEVEVLLDITISSKKRLFEEVGLCIEEKYGIPRSETFKALFAREKLGSTNIGHGIALPHGRLLNLKRFVGVFARLENPIQFESYRRIRCLQWIGNSLTRFIKSTQEFYLCL